MSFCWSFVGGSFCWKYLELQPERWVRFPADVELALEDAARRSQTLLTVTILGYTYDIDLLQETQTDRTTSTVRRIRRDRIDGLFGLLHDFGGLTARLASVDQYVAELASSKELSQKLMAELASSKQLNQQFVKEREEAKRAARESEAIATSSVVELRRLENNLQTAERSHAAKCDQLRETDAKLKHAEDQIERMSKQHKSLTAKVASLEQQVNRLSSMCEAEVHSMHDQASDIQIQPQTEQSAVPFEHRARLQLARQSVTRWKKQAQAAMASEQRIGEKLALHLEETTAEKAHLKETLGNILQCQDMLQQRYHHVLVSQLSLPAATRSQRCLPCNDPVFIAIEEMFQSSMVRHRQELPSDQWCDPPKVSVTRIIEIADGRKLDNYLQARYRMHSRAHACSPIHGMTAVKCKLGYSWKDMNEYMLYHGTRYENLDLIAEHGLNPLPALGGMFGRGVYFAQNASKSDFYTTCKECATHKCKTCKHAEGERGILVSRVLLGTTHIMKHTDNVVKGWVEPPCTRDSITAACKADGGVVDHMEFVVFKDPHMLVQFQIFYKHDTTCRCHSCQYRRR